MIVENMPGGGGVRPRLSARRCPEGRHRAQRRRPGDRLESVLGNLPGKIDAGTYSFIGRLTSNVEAQFTWQTSATKSLEEAKARR